MLAAILVVENVVVERGRLVVMPQANRSGFTYTDPMEGFPHTFEIDTPQGSRWFRVGMRLTNPIHQWPDPDIYVHHPSEELLLGSEARNLNRNFPGVKNGRFTERVGYAITRTLEDFDAELVLDMHEAYPEYPIINMLVAHQRAFEVATIAMLNIQANGISMDLMPSPEHLHGLSHREFGDHTDALAILSETANPAMGRFRGRTDEALVTTGRDHYYVRAARLGRLFVPFTEEGHPLEARVARQLITIEEMLRAYNDLNPGNTFVYRGLPPYDQVIEKGIGPFLKPVDRENGKAS